MIDRNYETSDLTGNVKTAATEYGSDALEAVESRASAFVDDVKHTVGGLRHRVEDTVQYLRDGGLRTMADKSVAYLRAHPTQALIGALALGYLAGRRMRRG